MEYISYITAMEGLGAALGAPFGSLFYQLAGYQAIFFGCGALMMVSSIVFEYILSPELDYTSNSEEQNENMLPISTKELLKYKRLLFAALTGTAASTIFNAPLPVLAIRLGELELNQ